MNIFCQTSFRSDEEDIDPSEVRRIDYGDWDPNAVEYHQFLQQYSQSSRNQSATSHESTSPTEYQVSGMMESYKKNDSKQHEAVQTSNGRTRIDGYQSNEKALLLISESPHIEASKSQKLLLDPSTILTSSFTFPLLNLRNKIPNLPERRATLAVSDYHDAMKSISSRNHEKNPYMRKLLNRSFASPNNLHDGPTEYGEERHESIPSQGFAVNEDNINFAKASHHRVLVTGGAGFIGASLVKKLLEIGHSVVVLDNLLTGSMNNLVEVYNHPRFVFINHDVTYPFPKRLVVDEIYHLACPSSPFFWQTNLINTFAIIVEGTRNVLDFAQKTGARLLIASTTEIYGDPESGVEVQTERYKGSVECFAERASHDEAKRAAETLCFAYQVERRVKIRIARIGSTYGPKMGVCDGSMISGFICALLEGIEISISETNESIRALLYVDDCVNGLIKLMNSNFTKPINIAGNDTISVKNLQLQLKALVANPSRAISWKQVEFYPDAGSRRPANTAAFANLNWYPEVKITEGLKSTIIWYRMDRERKAERKKRRDIGENVEEDVASIALTKVFSGMDEKRG